MRVPTHTHHNGWSIWRQLGVKRVCHTYCHISGHIKKRNTHKSAQNNVSKKRVDRSLPEKIGKNNKSARYPCIPHLSAKLGHPNTIIMSSSSSMMRLCSLDPPKYGWTACGGVSSILEPHEVSAVSFFSFSSFVRGGGSHSLRRLCSFLPSTGTTKQ